MLLLLLLLLPLPLGGSEVGVREVEGAGTVVAAGVLGARRVVVETVVGAGLVASRGVVGACAAVRGVVGEGLGDAREAVGAGPAVGPGGVVSGDWTEGIAAGGRGSIVRRGPPLGALVAGAVALEKRELGSPPKPGAGDASTCPTAPPPPVTFPAEVAETAAAAAQHNRARPPRLGRLLMARSAPPFIHSFSQPAGQSSSPS